MILNSVLVLVGGSIGAILRYKVDKEISKKISHQIPLGTLSVNLIGLFIIGFLYKIFTHYSVSNNLHIFIIVGFLGAFTTFSSYALHTFKLFEQKKMKLALINIFLNNIVGMLVAVLGALVGGLF